MKRIIVLFFLTISLCVQAQTLTQEPEKGAIGANVYTEFKSFQDASDYIVRECLLSRRILPLDMDAEYGYILSERTFTQGDFNAALLFIMSMVQDKVAVQISGRSYSSSTSTDSIKWTDFSNDGMRGSPNKKNWDLLQAIIEQIPSSRIEYFYPDFFDEERRPERKTLSRFNDSLYR